MLSVVVCDKDLLAYLVGQLLGGVLGDPPACQLGLGCRGCLLSLIMLTLILLFWPSRRAGLLEPLLASRCSLALHSSQDNAGRSSTEAIFGPCIAVRSSATAKHACRAFVGPHPDLDAAQKPAEHDFRYHDGRSWVPGKICTLLPKHVSTALLLMYAIS